MPLYEFHCEACDEEFEELVSSTKIDEVTCPSCGSGEVRRLQSGFATLAGSGGGRSAGASCSSGGSFG